MASIADYLHPRSAEPADRRLAAENSCTVAAQSRFFSIWFSFLWHHKSTPLHGGTTRLHRHPLLRSRLIPELTLMIAILFAGSAISLAQKASSLPVASADRAGGSRNLVALPPVPEPLDPSIARPIISNPAETNKQILDHLNAVLRYWRQTESPIQKVGEPSDLIYRNQVVDYAARIAADAFASAQAEALLLEPYEQTMSTVQSSQAQRIQALRLETAQRIGALKVQQRILLQQAAKARGVQAQKIDQQLQQTEGELELNNAIAGALMRLSKDSRTSGVTALESQVKQIQASAPDLTNPKIRLAAPPLESLSAARDAGVITKAQTLFSLLNTRSSLDRLIASTNRLSRQATELHQPLVQILRATVAKGEQMAQSPPDIGPSASHLPSGKAADNAANLRKQYDDLTLSFQSIVAASMPLSKELLVLGQMQAALHSWRASVDEEYRSILISLLVRVAAIAFALLVIFTLGAVWRRITMRYIRDIRRRRQWTVLRRLILGFLTGIVLIFGFVTQFSSLATFAGFITAGLAVGLQTILLSLAAYFFIIGRYGVRVGDRITIANVTGDVIEVGLLRFYVLEVAPAGSLPQSTGRVAVFSNAILFQALTPLYKQLPGTEYTWHQIMVKLDPGKNYRAAAQRILDCVQHIYETYRENVERQHRNLENWMDMPLDGPRVQSNIQLQDGGLQLWIRYPAALRGAATEDEQIAEAILQLIASDEEVRAAVTAPPVIQPTTR